MFLLGAAFLAIGVFASSLTQNQVIAFFIALVILLMLWIADSASAVFPGAIGNVTSYLSLAKHNDDFFRGVIDSSNVVYILSVIVVSLFLATQVLQTRRWR